jgi:hypothetical protein
LLAALTAVATASGEVGRMFRNHAIFTSIALSLVLVAILCGLLTQAGASWSKDPRLLIVGSVALILSMGCALIAEVKTLALSDRPIITSTQERSGSTVTFSAHVQGRKAKAHDQIVVVIYGVTPSNVRTSPIYYAKTGPNTSGDLEQDIHLEINSARYGGVYVSAVVVPEDVRPPTVDCDGDVVGSDGSNLVDTSHPSSDQHVSFRPNGQAPLVGCLTVQFP